MSLLKQTSAQLDKFNYFITKNLNKTARRQDSLCPPQSVSVIIRHTCQILEFRTNNIKPIIDAPAKV